MAKKPSPKTAKGFEHKKHGPKRHLNHDYFPQALRMDMAQHGVLTKYNSFDSFCVSMQARGVRADYKLLWAEFRALKTMDKNGEPLPNAREMMRDFFVNAKQIGIEAMKKQKKADRS